MANKALESDSVRRVRAALAAKGVADKVQALADTARTAQDAAKALKVPTGAIVKTLAFRVGEETVLALVAGDKACKADALPRVLNLTGTVRPCTADEVRATTGFAIGGVAPVGGTAPLKVAIDVSLKRFERLFAAAGHPHCVFETSVRELKQLTGGIVSYALTDA